MRRLWSIRFPFFALLVLPGLVAGPVVTPVRTAHLGAGTEQGAVSQALSANADVSVNTTVADPVASEPLMQTAPLTRTGALRALTAERAMSRPAPRLNQPLNASLEPANEQQAPSGMQPAAVVVVNTATAIVDGDTRSITALIEEPGDDERISFLEALAAVNNTGGGHTIAFNLAAGTLISFNQTAVVQVPNTTINGDMNNDGRPDIGLEVPSSFISLALVSSGNRVTGLFIHGLAIAGTGATGNTVTKNYIGTDATGRIARGANSNGLQIQSGARDNTIVDNLVAGNSATSGSPMAGIIIGGAHSNRIENNRVGVNSAGAALPNDLGIALFDGARNHVIGGSRSAAACAAPCNLISGNKFVGVYIDSPGSNDNRVEGNYIGVNAAGTAALPNGDNGVMITDQAKNNTIGGSRTGVACTGPCNVIAGNGNNGVALFVAGTTGNIVAGNYIGLNTASQPLPNGSHGIWVHEGASENRIGGTRTSAACVGPCNVIAGNTEQGILISAATTISTTVTGNFIGVKPAGTEALPNGGNGIALAFGTNKNTIGGTRTGTACTGPCNLIGGNGDNGILIQDPTTTGNIVSGNFLGLKPDGATGGVINGLAGVTILNSAGNRVGGTGTQPAPAGNHIAGHRTGILVFRDPDANPTGPTDRNTLRGNLFIANQGPALDLQPGTGLGVEKDAANKAIGTPALERRVASAPPRTWRGRTLAPNGSIVDLYGGSGRVYAGSAVVNNGRWEVLVPNTTAVPLGAQVVATVTDPNGNTSEFSAPGVLDLLAPIAIPNGQVFVTAIITDTRGQPLFSAKAVTVTVDGKDYAMRADGKEEDLFEDQYYSGWLQAPATPGTYSVTLALSRTGTLAVPLTVSATPRVAILSDIYQLKQEFDRTGGNQPVEFYRAMKRMADYAEKYRGFLLDPRVEVKETEPGNNRAYKTYDYASNVSARRLMGVALDNHINTLTQYRADLKYLAIVGDDAVIPFFRRHDTSGAGYCGLGNQEGCYPAEVNGLSQSPTPNYGSRGNATLDDSRTGHMMTDVPYASFDASSVQAETKPLPDMAVGRIFAAKPADLRALFDAYEQPVRLDPSRQIAAGVHLPNEYGLNGTPDPQGAYVDDRVWWVNDFNYAIAPHIARYYTPTLQLAQGTTIPANPIAGRFYRFNGATNNWTVQNAMDAIRRAPLAVIYSHANQFSESTPNPTVNITPSNLAGLPQLPGHLVINAGCHSGYSTSFAADTGAPSFYSSFATTALSRQLTWLAPTVYGYGDNYKLAYHDRLFFYFLQAALDWAPTVGQSYLTAQRKYVQTGTAVWGWTGGWDNLDTYIRYGTALYGLPTQPIATASGVRPFRSLEVLDSASQDAPLATRTLDVTVDTPNFRVVTGSNGTTRFELPNNGRLGGEAYRPLLPQVLRSYRLPAGANITGVTLVEQQSRPHPQPVTMQNGLPVNTNEGPRPGTSPYSGVYPPQIYSVASDAVDDGVEMNVTVTPFQYRPATRQATLFSHVKLRITYTVPDSDTTITALQANGGQAMTAPAASVPVRATITSTRAQTGELSWRIVDGSGTEVGSGKRPVTLRAGANTLTFPAATPTLHPGEMLLTATFGDGTTARSEASQTFLVRGRSLLVTTDRVEYEEGATATVEVAVYDETSAPVNGLAGSLRATLNGRNVALPFTALGTGRYRATLPLRPYQPGGLTLRVSAAGVVPEETGFRIAAEQQSVYLPLVLR